MFRADEMRGLFRPTPTPAAPHDPWPNARPAARVRRDWLAAVQYRDITAYLPLDILTKVDRATMAHSLEARPPLLDHRLAEFAATIPATYRLREARPSTCSSRRCAASCRRIIDRQKHGFAVPIAAWLRGDLAEFARVLLLSSACRRRGVFEPAQVERLLALNARGRDLDLQLWTMLSFELWCQRFLDSSPRQQPAPVRTARRISSGVVRVTTPRRHRPAGSVSTPPFASHDAPPEATRCRRALVRPRLARRIMADAFCEGVGRHGARARDRFADTADVLAASQCGTRVSDERLSNPRPPSTSSVRTSRRRTPSPRRTRTQLPLSAIGALARQRSTTTPRERAPVPVISWCWALALLRHPCCTADAHAIAEGLLRQRQARDSSAPSRPPPTSVNALALLYVAVLFPDSANRSVARRRRTHCSRECERQVHR
jgi:hypothetical protein